MGTKPSRIQSSEHQTELNHEDTESTETKCEIQFSPELVQHLIDLETVQKAPDETHASTNKEPNRIEIQESELKRQMQQAYLQGVNDAQERMKQDENSRIEDSTYQAKQAKEMEVHSDALVHELIASISEKKYNAPVRQVRCVEERNACFDCYKSKSDDVYQCKELAQAFVSCARQSTQQFVANSNG